MRVWVCPFSDHRILLCVWTNCGTRQHINRRVSPARRWNFGAYKAASKRHSSNIFHTTDRLSLFFGHEAAGLYNVATIPAARRQGIMTHTVVTALQTARVRGYHVAVLGPTPESERMYARIGFIRHDSVETAYTLPFSDAHDS